ncbi:Pycsar system effector family protein [Herbidospora sp. RD11066]
MILWRRPPDPVPPLGEDAWRALTLVIDWIKHAESKAGLTLAAAGAIGGILYALINGEKNASVGFVVAVIVTTVLLLISVACSAMVLRPRTRATADPSSLLFYRHVAARYGKRPDAFTDDFGALIRDPDALLREVATQVWTNSLVADSKYRWSSRSVVFLLLSLLALGASSLIGLLT